MSQGALPTDRVAKFLGKAGLAPMPAWSEQPVKSAPKKKAQERAKAAAAAGGLSGAVPQNRILLGVIGRPHGVRGLVRVHQPHRRSRRPGRVRTAVRRQGPPFTLRWRGEGIAEVRRVARRRAGEGRRPRQRRRS